MTNHPLWVNMTVLLVLPCALTAVRATLPSGSVNAGGVVMLPEQPFTGGCVGSFEQSA